MAKLHKGKYYGKKNWVNKTIGYPQSQANRDITTPVRALNNYELDLASGAIPPETTFEEWRAMQKGEPGTDGKDGTGIEIKGTLNSYTELLAVVDPQPGDSYAVNSPVPGESALLYTYNEETGWPAEGEGIPIQGEPGAPGEDGDSYIPETTTNYFDI